MASPRVFVAVRPSDGARSELAAVDLVPSEALRVLPSGQWHATLRFLGVCDPDEVVGRLQRLVLPGVVARLAPVALLGDRVVVAPVEGLEELAGAVRGATAGLGRSERHPFRGHITLARLRRVRGREAGRLPLGHPLSARWCPEELEVVSSVTHPQGASHTVLARLPLGNA